MKRIAVAGNPNSGKSCIFNNLTGGRQRVGNYAGVTVEYVEGTSEVSGEKLNFIDLPGTYSLTAYSEEERVARDFILKEKPDAILVVLDASNLERNLYFTIQLIELGRPVVIALNMVDVAKKKGFDVDAELLSKLLNVKVIPTIAVKNEGMEELKKACLDTISQGIMPKNLDYGHEVDEHLIKLTAEIEATPSFCHEYPAKWLAIKLLEEDAEIIDRLKESTNTEGIERILDETQKHLHNHSGEDTITAVIEARHAIASGASRECMASNLTGKQLLTDQIDAVVCNRFFGPLILAAVVYALYTFVFSMAEDVSIIYTGGDLFNAENWASPVGAIELLFENMTNWADTNIESPMLKSLICDGIIGGVGGILGFTPLIFFMFMFISVLEDSGYIARVAFILDRVLRTFGLQGKSILALIVSGGLGGGGCAVPGVMATRTLREEKDRLITILVAPLMNCGAKMPVFLMLVAAFFTGYRTEMMLLIWALSWAFALIAAWCLRKWVVKGEQTPFVMELPIYHIPTFKGVLIHTWYRTWMYVKKAGTIILALSIVLWAAMYFPRNEEMTKGLDENKAAQVQMMNSYAGKLGKTLEPVSKLAGFDWKDNIALIGGWAAKEIVIGTLGTVYAMGDVDPEESESLQSRLATDPDWNPLRAFAMILFVMIYAPCVVTLAAIKKETGSWKWTIFATGYTTIAGFIVATLFYQIGSLFM